MKPSENGQELSAYAAVDAAFAGLPLVDPPVGLAAAVMDQVRRTPQARGTGVDWRAFGGGLFVAVTLTAAALWALAVWTQRLLSPYNVALWHLESWYWAKRWELVILNLGEVIDLSASPVILLTGAAFMTAGILLAGGVIILLFLLQPNTKRSIG